MVIGGSCLLLRKLFHCSILWLSALFSSRLCVVSWFRSNLAYLLQPFFCNVAITPIAVSCVLCLYLSRVIESEFIIEIKWFLSAVMCLIPSAVRL